MHKFQLRQFIKIREAKENNHKFANRKMRLELETFPNSLSIFRLREIFTHNIITQGTTNKKAIMVIRQIKLLTAGRIACVFGLEASLRST